MFKSRFKVGGVNILNISYLADTYILTIIALIAKINTIKLVNWVEIKFASIFNK